METLEELLKKPDDEWYKEEFNRAEEKKLSVTEMDKIVQKSKKSAEDVYLEVKNDLNNLGIDDMINRYGTEVSYNEKNDSDRLIAMYDNKKNMLIVFNHSLNTLHQRIQNIGMEHLLDKKILKALVTSHELYHIIEMNEEDIYTYSKMYESNFLGFSKMSRIATASEIGAYHFSKLVTGVSFSPCIVGSLHEITQK